ncbi:MAG: hypothetical protein ACH346_00295 [Chthoniobacterales bacterium]
MLNISQCQKIIRGDLFQKKCDHIFWNNEHAQGNMKFRGGVIVFCKIDEVLRFFEKLRLTRRRIILVTGEGDFPCDAWRQQFLPVNVACWFATNVTHPHPRVCALPLGLGTPKDTVTLDVATMVSSKEEVFSRDQWLYINFRPETNPEVRCEIYDYFELLAERESWITFEKPSEENSSQNFLRQLLCHRFILAPPGNGFDTHRLWEALLLGAYPVVLNSIAMEPFADLPILFFDDFQEITLDFLKENISQLKEKEKNLSMLQIDFWEEKIQKAKKDLQRKKHLTLIEWLSESFLYGNQMLKRRFQKYD